MKFGFRVRDVDVTIFDTDIDEETEDTLKMMAWTAIVKDGNAKEFLIKAIEEWPNDPDYVDMYNELAREGKIK